MWVVVVFPPVVAPWDIDRPRICPWCGNGGTMHIHQRVVRTLSHMQQAPLRSTGQSIPSSYSTPRFRCTICRRTFTGPIPNRAQRFRFQKYLEARIVTCYCRGDTISQIMTKLDDDGVRISRSTLYNVINSVNDAELSRLHRVNRRRSMRAFHRGSKSTTFVGSFNLGHEHQIDITAANHDVFENLGPSAYVIVVRWVVEMFFVYRNINTISTLDWIDNHLRELGQAGVLTYHSLVDLEHDFDQYGVLTRMGSHSPYEFFIPIGSLGDPFDKATRMIQDAVAVALRMAAMDDEDRRIATVNQLVLEDGHSSLSINLVADEDIFDAP